MIEPGAWHDWWNASDRDTRVRVEITPGERFSHMIETLFGLARLGHVNGKGMPDPLQLALMARVQRRDRVPLAAAGASARGLRCARSDRAPARLPRHLPAAVAHGAGAADVGAALQPKKVSAAA